jgi:hypothetical protein
MEIHFVGWDEAQDRLWTWEILIPWLAIGSFVNFVQLVVHLSIPQLRKQSICRIIVWISAIDFTFDFLDLLQCSFSLYVKGFFGKQLFCTFQGFWTEWLLCLQGFSIGTMMLASYLAIVHNRTLSMKEIDKLHVGAVGYCLILAFLGNVMPGHASLNTSGLFCYTASHRITEALLLHIGYILPLTLGLFVIWFRLFRKVKYMTKFLATRKINVEARRGQVRMAKRLAWYLGIMCACYAPFEMAVGYSWVTSNPPPSQLWIAFALSAHLLTIANPILYYMLNQSARALVYNYLSEKLCHRLTDPESALPVSQSDSKSSFTEKGKLVNDDQIEEFVHALSDTSILNQILAFAESQFCSEGILFWIDVQVWRTMCSKISCFPPVSRPPSLQQNLASWGLGKRKESKDSPTITPTAITQVEMQDLKENKSQEVIQEVDLGALREFAKNVYLTYFARGSYSAPLELNVRDDVQAQVYQELKILETKDGPVCNFQLQAALIHVFDRAEHEILKLLYENVYRSFAKKISMPNVRAHKEKLNNLQFGNILPFQPRKAEDRSARSPARLSQFNPLNVVLPKAGGMAGVSTRIKKSFEREESVSAIETSLNTSPHETSTIVNGTGGEVERNSPESHTRDELNLSSSGRARSRSTEASESPASTSIIPATPQSLLRIDPPQQPPALDVVHVGIDSVSSLRIVPPVTPRSLLLPPGVTPPGSPRSAMFGAGVGGGGGGIGGGGGAGGSVADITGIPVPPPVFQPPKSPRNINSTPPHSNPGTPSRRPISPFRGERYGGLGTPTLNAEFVLPPISEDLPPPLQLAEDPK